MLLIHFVSWRRKVFCAISYHICLRKQIFTKLTFCQISLPPCFGLIRESHVGSAALELHPSPPTDEYNFHQLRKVLAALLSAIGGFTLLPGGWFCVSTILGAPLGARAPCFHHSNCVAVILQYILHVSVMGFGGGILGGAHKTWGNPYLKCTTVPFDDNGSFINREERIANWYAIEFLS